MSLQAKTIHSFKWSFFAEFISSLVLLIVYIANAKLLKPEDFGIVTAAMILISFSQIIWGGGLAKTLIQRQDRIDESANVIFWTNILIGGFLFAVLFLLSPWIANLFNDSRISDVIKILGLLIVFSSISSVQMTLFQKEFQFKKIFWIRILTVALPGLTSIPMAFYGYGYWALVAGGLIGQFFQTILLWFLSSWRPKFYFDFLLFKELVSFGKWVLLSSLSAWFYLWVDSMFVGIYFDSQNLGIYRTGNFFSTMILGIIFAPLIPVLYSAFSKISFDKEKLKKKHELVVKLLAMISLPMGFGLFALQDLIEVVFFNSHWFGISKVIGILGLAHAISWIVGANGEVYRAIGRPEIETKVVSYTLIFYFIAYLVSMPYGLDIFIWTRFSLTCCAMFVSFYFARKILEFPIIRWFSLTVSSFIASFIMFGIIKKIEIKNFGSIGNLVILVLTGIVVYLILILILELKFIKLEILPLIRSKKE